MKNQEIIVPRNKKFLSEVFKELPSKCLLDKGVTGCGGTTLELKSKRSSIIAVPNISLVLNKRSDKILGVYGDTVDLEVKKYLENSKITHKKIIVTYDSLPRIIDYIGKSIFTDYFLLIDEYHILLNSYVFRNSAITSLLKTFIKFKNYCLMTATPLKGLVTLKEFKNIPTISLKWEAAVPVKVKLTDTYYIASKLKDAVNYCMMANYNLHIFCNSLKMITKIVKDTGINDYRIVCSKESRSEYKNYKCKDITSNVERINFYTSTCFEGVDIYDKVGKTIVVSDTTSESSMLDISTLFRQICGRLRDSKFKDEVDFIVNTKKHRYCQHKSKLDFEEFVGRNELIGRNKAKTFRLGNELDKEGELRVYSDKFQDIYLVKDENEIIYDDNFRIVDLKNYECVQTYVTGISVLKNLEENCTVTEVYTEKVYKSSDIISELHSSFDYTKWYKLKDIISIFKATCNNYGVSYQRSQIDEIFNIKEKRFREEGSYVRLYQLIKK